MTDADVPGSRAWRDAERTRLLDFGLRCPHPDGGAAWLTTTGEPDLTQPVATWITARMVHVYGLGVLLGHPGSREVATACLRALADRDGALRGGGRGAGWLTERAADGTPTPGRSAYAHAFVVLAATTAVTAGLSGAGSLLDEAVETFERFWVEDDGLVVDAFLPADAPDDDPWARVDEYRGLNAAMHSVEAFLALHDLTGEAPWLDRATAGVRFAAGLAADHDGRLPEHFDAAWTPDPERFADHPDDAFKPYGATVGHGMEWSRLTMQVAWARLRRDPADPEAGRWPWLPTAELLFSRALRDGWDVDGAPGFVYTTDWSGRPIVRDRMHWVAAEAVAAASTLHARTGAADYARLHDEWWRYVAEHVVDPAGSWHHQLDPQNRPTDTVWPGSPDLYHAVTATLVPDVEVGVGPAAGVRAAQLE